MPLCRVDQGGHYGCPCAWGRGESFITAAHGYPHVSVLTSVSEQTITVLLMTCVGYDHDFAADFSSFKDYKHRTVKVSNTAKDEETGRRSSSIESDL